MAKKMVSHALEIVPFCRECTLGFIGVVKKTLPVSLDGLSG